MLLKEDSSELKLSGIYYTPGELAEGMVQKLQGEPFTRVLEPSCGEGIFLEKVLQAAPNVSITAIDNDEKTVARVIQSYQHRPNIHVSCEDFFDFYPKARKSRRYDLIIGNPPYIRYQYLTEKQRSLQASILLENGMRSNKLINTWVAFMVACVNLLADRGMIAFVVPAELLQVAYAKDLRTYLVGHLDDITVITFKELIFQGIQQETVVFYGRQGEGNHRIRVIEARDIEDFVQMDLDPIPFHTVTEDDAKWTKYFVSDQSTGIIDTINQDPRFHRFSDCGIINVGITTGNNKYFSITKETEEKYHLEGATLPLIGRSSHIHGIYFTRADWESNREAGRRAMLVNFPDVNYDDYPEGYKEYIAWGEAHGENTGYKCRIRDRWYIVPSVWVPDAFFLRRNHLYPKLVLNRCGAVSTDTMHRMKFHEGVNGEDLLLSYYNSISFAYTEICGRSYGGGVLEILPGEMGNIRVPDLSKVDPKKKAALLAYVDQVIRKDADIESALDKVDRMLIEDLAIPEEWCHTCRRIWKTMQTRRLTRGEKR